MNDAQKSQFQNFGCTCKALLALANAKGNLITKEKFIDDFGKRCPFWEQNKQCGITDTGLTLDIIRYLNIGQSFQIFISKQKVREWIHDKEILGILLFTEKWKEDDGTYSNTFHCTGLIAPQIIPDSPAGPCFALVQINDDISLSLPMMISDLEIDRMVGYFLVIY